MSATVRPAGGARSARILVECALVAGVVLAYLWLFRAYGFDVVDEGTQLAQIDRVARGARPYVDFETGYTPWYYLLEVAVWRLAGTELLATRTLGVLVHTATVTLLYGFARAWFGAPVALCLAALDVAFLLPVSPRAGAPFNTPYPGWLTAPLALLGQLAVAAVARRRLAGEARDGPARGSAALVLGAGLAAGVAFSLKPNAGSLVLGGALLALVATWPREQRGARALAWLVRGAAIAATLGLLGTAVLDPLYAAALLLPVVVAALGAAPRGTGREARPLVDLALLAAGFLAPIAVWAIPLLAQLGAARFAREVLLLDGGGVIAAYLLRLAPPSPGVLALCAALLLAAGLARRAGESLARRAVWPVATVVVVGLALDAALSPASLLRTAEEACLWLGPTVLVAGLLLMPRRPDTARVHALLTFAATFSLQLFPRPDLIHVAMGGPPLLLGAGAAWWKLARPFARRRGGPGALPRGWIAAALVLALCAGRAYPALYTRLDEPLAALDAGPRAPLYIARRHAAEHEWLGAAVRAIAARTAPGAAVFYYPDLAGLGFLSERPSPTYYLYFVPGRPDRAGEERTIGELERSKPELAVTGQPRVPAFAAAREYFTALEAYLGRSYRQTEALSDCTILERVEAR